MNVLNLINMFYFSESEEGWENPFQPEGEVSQDAEMILRLWKGGNLDTDLETALAQLHKEKVEEMEEVVAEVEVPEVPEDQEGNQSTASKPETKEDTRPTSERINTDTRLVQNEKLKHKNLLKKLCSLM